MLSRASALGLRPPSRIMASTLGLLPVGRTEIVKGSPAMRGAYRPRHRPDANFRNFLQGAGLRLSCRGRNSIRKTCDRAGAKSMLERGTQAGGSFHVPGNRASE